VGFHRPDSVTFFADYLRRDLNPFGSRSRLLQALAAEHRFLRVAYPACPKLRSPPRRSRRPLQLAAIRSQADVVRRHCPALSNCASRSTAMPIGTARFAANPPLLPLVQDQAAPTCSLFKSPRRATPTSRSPWLPSTVVAIRSCHRRSTRNRRTLLPRARMPRRRMAALRVFRIAADTDRRLVCPPAQAPNRSSFITMLHRTRRRPPSRLREIR